MPLTRRHLIAASGTGIAAGGSAAVLAACGADARDDRTADRDVELLQRALTAESTLARAYETASEQALGPAVAAAVDAFGATAREHLVLLSSRITDAGGTPDDAPGSQPAAESAVEAIRIALDDAIAACHDVVGALSTTDARRAVYRVMIVDCGQLAAIRGVLGEQQVPVAFVTGGPDPPLAVDPDTVSPESGS